MVRDGISNNFSKTISIVTARKKGTVGKYIMDRLPAHSLTRYENCLFQSWRTKVTTVYYGKKQYSMRTMTRNGSTHVFYTFLTTIITS
jgi:hypothetical protein